MKYALVAVALLAGCGAAPLDAATRVANTTARVTNAAETGLAKLYASEQKRCLKPEEPAPRPCLAEVSRRFERAWLAHDSLYAAWLGAVSVIGVAHALDVSGGDVDEGAVLTAVQRMTAAQAAFAAALQAAQEARK